MTSHDNPTLQKTLILQQKIRPTHAFASGPDKKGRISINLIFGTNLIITLPAEFIHTFSNFPKRIFSVLPSPAIYYTIREGTEYK